MVIHVHQIIILLYLMFLVIIYFTGAFNYRSIISHNDLPLNAEDKIATPTHVQSLVIYSLK